MFKSPRWQPLEGGPSPSGECRALGRVALIPSVRRASRPARSTSGTPNLAMRLRSPLALPVDPSHRNVVRDGWRDVVEVALRAARLCHATVAGVGSRRY